MSESESRLTRASEPSESHTTQSEAKADTACDSLLDTVKSTVDPFKETFSSDGSVLHHLSAGVNSLASLQGMPSQLLNTGIAQIPLLDKVPGMPAATIGVPHLGTPHAHSHPPSNDFPLPSFGTTIGAGCLSVLIGGIPAARVLDIGFAPTCGGLTPYFDIQTGSSNTFFGGMRAARMGIDMTRHCNPMGHVGKSGGEAASAAEKSEEVASEAAQVTGRAKALGLAGKAWSVGNAALGPASGAATAASDIKHHEALAAAMTAAQTAADLAFMMLSNLMGKDPGIEPSMGTLLMGDPTVLIGGFPLPDSQMMWHGAKHGIGKKIRPKLPKWAQKLACELFGEPVSAVTGDVENDFTDYETDEVVPFKWGRHYSSRWHERDGPLGYGFRHAWQHELRLLRTRAVYTDPRGTEYPFSRRADATYGGYCQGYGIEQLDDRHFIVRHEVEGDLEFERSSAADRFAHCVGRIRNGAHSLLYWNEKGRLARMTQADESGHVQRAIAFGYDLSLRIVEIALTEVNGHINRIARYAYDVNGCLVSYRNALDAESVSKYDAHRRVVRLTDANDYSFIYRYDGEGRCVESSGQDGLWHVQFQYHPGRTTVTEGDGGRWTVVYNDAGTITHVDDPYGGATEYVLGASGRIIEEIDSGGHTLRWVYDGREHNTGRVDRWKNIWPVKDDAPNLPNPFAHTVPSTALDLQWGKIGRTRLADSVLLPPDITKIAVSIFASATPTVSPSEQRNALGRVIARIDERGRTEQLRYDAAGNLLQRRDKDGRDYYYSTVSWNLRESETDPLDNTVRFRYTSKREIEAIVDANGNESSYTYDFKDRVTSVRRHGVLRETYTYDAGDRLIEKRDSVGNLLLRLDVGADGLYSKRTLASGEVHTYEYDVQGNLTKASTKTFDVTMAHDATNRRTADKRDGSGVAHAYSDGQLICTTYFERFEVRYEAVCDGEVVIHTPVGKQRLRRTSDDRILLCLANGTNAVYGFNGSGTCSGRIVWSNKSRTRGPRWVQYQYSAENELRCVIDSEKNVTEYEYDAAHRLIGESRNGWAVRRFDYDRGGNLLSTLEQPWMRYTEGNRLTRSSSGEFHYNHRNHIAEEIDMSGRCTTYHYNSLDMLVKIEWSDRHESWTAEYDGECRRIYKSDGDRRTDFYWDGDRLAAERTSEGRLRLYVYVNEAVFLPFMFIDYESLDSPLEQGQARFVFQNQVGLPEWIEDGCGNIVWRAEQISPYGLVTVAAGNVVEYALRFPGHYFDAETGLHYNRFRYYSPTHGRYLQSDPAGQSGGINLYAYASNPLHVVDVLGLAHSPKNGKSGRTNTKTSLQNKEEVDTQSNQNIHPQSGNPILAEQHYWRDNIDLLVAYTKPSQAERLILVHPYENPGHHDPNGGIEPYNTEKSVLPDNHIDLFNSSKPFVMPNGKILRWTLEDGVYHRFEPTINGTTYHWTGSTNGKTLSGVEVPLHLPSGLVGMFRDN
ncbi:RHS repeat-associated core domain-containing protein [Burkholderia anthina]|uniref:RHS repeat-associated core domain-containing protein n=1 Tax=Burkholderia anthina TaxID=179879 RepID=UPI0037BEE621